MDHALNLKLLHLKMTILQYNQNCGGDLPLNVILTPPPTHTFLWPVYLHRQRNINKQYKTHAHIFNTKDYTLLHIKRHYRCLSVACGTLDTCFLLGNPHTHINKLLAMYG